MLIILTNIYILGINSLIVLMDINNLPRNLLESIKYIIQYLKHILNRKRYYK